MLRPDFPTGEARRRLATLLVDRWISHNGTTVRAATSAGRMGLLRTRMIEAVLALLTSRDAYDAFAANVDLLEPIAQRLLAKRR